MVIEYSINEDILLEFLLFNFTANLVIWLLSVKLSIWGPLYRTWPWPMWGETKNVHIVKRAKMSAMSIKVMRVKT